MTTRMSGPSRWSIPMRPVGRHGFGASPWSDPPATRGMLTMGVLTADKWG